ncbi:MAG: asparagine synthase (glutamine-hydrolyzing) [Desulforudis sp.]|jgi:asparagine synthase (glutamine-hydrolysing)|nr:asparagine synthase (glutamine-hydrolyzing) [Clostridia bacterium]MDQ7791357.1 asparagine synthase (glutamine-hydrolyzing) [Clostridia bacterium]RJX17260.1 MAG: asparagine synthase (glutamine-hydrolyzing) [Desulforudis sp.]
MCGITGWIDWDDDLTGRRPILDAMTETLSARGPDASGAWISRHAALGHRRLVVVDPAGGGQPMVRRRGEREYVLVYNGELYNTPDLHRELKARGYTFQGHSDTEALLLAFIEWGPDCLERLNGIFAFAVWSEADQRLFMVRDRMGVKPLFYTERGNAFLFGSELKALLAHPLVPPEVDAEGLAEVFLIGPARTPGHGVFRGVSELRPGYCLFYDRKGLRLHRYWTLESKPHTDDLKITAEKVRALFQDSVERQMVADVPVCTLLSGGLDSTAITTYAAGIYKQRGLGPLHTYSIDYVDNDKYFHPHTYQPDSDATWVEFVSGWLESHHHQVLIDTPNLVEALNPAVLARDLPGMADVDSSLLLFCRKIKKQSTVALSGECADEVFGGYPWFHREEDLAAGTFPWSKSVRSRMSLLSPELAGRLKPEEYVSQRYHDTLAEVPRLTGEPCEEACRREMFYLNMVWFMQTLLDRKDRMSMATGLEVRVPFCDHWLVEYVWNIPWEMKTYNDREKGILRLALQDVLPREIIERRKSPYPKTHNPGYLAAVQVNLQRILDDPNSPLLPLIDTNLVSALVRTDGSSFGPAWFGQLMAGPQLFAYLAQVDTWLRKYRVKIC